MNSVCVENLAVAGGHIHRAKLATHELFKNFADPQHEMHAMGNAEAATKEAYRVPWDLQMKQPGAVHVAVPEYRPGVSFVERRIRSQKVNLSLRWTAEELAGTVDAPKVNDHHELIIKAQDVMPFRCADPKHKHQHYLMAMVLTSAHTSYFPEAAEMEVNITSLSVPLGHAHSRPAEETKHWLRERVADVRNRKGGPPLRFLGYVLRAQTRLERPEYWFTAPANTSTRHFHMIEAIQDGILGLGRDVGRDQVMLPAAVNAAGVPSNIATAMVLREWKSYVTHGKPFAALSPNQLPVLAPNDEAGIIVGREELKMISGRIAAMLHEGSGLWQSDLKVQFTLLDFAEVWQPILLHSRPPKSVVGIQLELILFTVVLGG